MAREFAPRCGIGAWAGVVVEAQHRVLAEEQVHAELGEIQAILLIDGVETVEPHAPADEQMQAPRVVVAQLDEQVGADLAEGAWNLRRLVGTAQLRAHVREPGWSPVEGAAQCDAVESAAAVIEASLEIA